MELRNPSQISLSGSLLIHALAVWVVAQQVTFPELVEPKPKMKVQVVKKEPPPPPPSKAKPPKPVQPVQKQSTAQPKKMKPQKPVQTQPQQVTPEMIRKVSTVPLPKMQTAPQKPVTRTVHPTQPVAKPKMVTAKVTPPAVKPVENVPNKAPATTLSTATAIRHTTSKTEFKAQVNPVPHVNMPQTVPTQYTASLKTPVSTFVPQATTPVEPVTTMTANNTFTGEAAQPIQTAKLDPIGNDNLKPVEKVALDPGPPGPDVQKALDQFNNAIWAKILKAKFYPKLAQMRRQEGQPVVKFTIEKDGTLGDITIESSSNHEILDKAALKTIENAAPFPEIPEILKEERIVLEVPISFILNQ